VCLLAHWLDCYCCRPGTIWWCREPRSVQHRLLLHSTACMLPVDVMQIGKVQRMYASGPRPVWVGREKQVKGHRIHCFLIFASNAGKGKDRQRCWIKVIGELDGVMVR
jgi:hypothetical protein